MKYNEITATELRNLDNIESYEVWDEETERWVDASTSFYMYDGPIGFSSIEDPYAPINSIALYNSWENRMVVYAVPPKNYTGPRDEKTLLKSMNNIAELSSDYKTEVFICKDEHELLSCFLIEIEDADVLSGWNCIPLTQTIWGNNNIVPISELTTDLYDSKLIQKFPITKKEKWDIRLANGAIFSASEKHKFPVLSHVHGKYTNLTNKSINHKILTTKEIAESKDVIFLKIKLGNNLKHDNIDYTNEMLYLAGLIYTDGTLKDKNNKSNGFTIYQSDYQMLDSLPLLTTKILGPWKNNYSRNVKWSLIKPAFDLIYNVDNKKKLNISLLSTLSYSQFMSFLSGLLDGAGFVTKNTITWCNYNNDINLLYELCLWNGIFSIIQKNNLRLIKYNFNDLILYKNNRWKNFKPKNLNRNNKQKAELTRFKIINDECFVRVDSVINTNKIVKMMDIETSTHYFYTMGVRTHNCDFFDTPYIGKRLEMMGKRYLKKLSFPEGLPPRFREVDVQFRTQWTLELSGRISADYLLIFKKYEVVERPTYRLEAIAEEILIDPKTKEATLPKLEYEGSLASLYNDNFEWFIRYNLRDTEILKGFEDCLGYVELANQMYHLSTGLFKHVTGTLKLSELATINYCHYELDGMIVNDNHIPSQTEKAKGAFVLLPQVGMHEWIGAIDINSLYISAMRSNNISPETIIGQFIENEKAFEEIKKRSFAELTLELDSGEAATATADEWYGILINKHYCISGYGTVFSLEKQGIMPSILGDWHATRKKYQKMLVEAKESGDQIKSTYYNKLQYVYKIKLNSYYGSLLNQYFRFYDKRLGESTTATGRAILLYQCSKVCEVLDGKFAPTDRLEHDKDGKPHIGYTNKWSVIYGDTDSTYFKTHARNEEEAVKVADAVGEVTSASFPKFMRETFLCSEGFDDIIETSREIVSDRGIFVDKKRYFLHIVDNEGFKCDKIKVMGLDTKKTTLPKEVSKKLNKFVENHLKGEEWDSIAVKIVDYKEELYNTNKIMSIGLPKGVKNVEAYTSEYLKDEGTRLPGHVAASIFYNICLKNYEDKESLEIRSGMKIKVFYLNRMYGRFKSIAIPVDIEIVPQWFLDNFKVDMPAHIERLVDNPMNNIIKAIGKMTPSKQSLLTDSMLGF